MLSESELVFLPKYSRDLSQIPQTEAFQLWSAFYYNLISKDLPSLSQHGYILSLTQTVFNHS
jgi:hypothetical protein